MNLEEAIKIIKDFTNRWTTFTPFWDYNKLRENPPKMIKWAEDCMKDEEKYNNEIKEMIEKGASCEDCVREKVCEDYKACKKGFEWFLPKIWFKK